MLKRLLFILLITLITTSISCQVFRTEPPYVLSIQELKDWFSLGPTASLNLISRTPLAERVINPASQLNPDLDNRLEIAWLPDGMSNFASYHRRQSTFNLYNFTHWAYIDKLIWFGGTFEENVQIPSRPWVNTAHKNGVKVYANIFFAPTAFGGNNEKLEEWLEKDDNGEFLVISKMVEIMEFYGFDGWFINQETSTTEDIGLRMHEFMIELTEKVEKEGKDVMWYDAMLLDGRVAWQNEFNTNNSPFLQFDLDGNSDNGRETRVSSNMFINFFWRGSDGPTGSRNEARRIGRSEYEIYSGIDVWPGRNQSRFQNGGNTWMSSLFEDELNPITSLGFFAPNCVYNNSEYSSFNINPGDYKSFYSEERHLFAGNDRNPLTVDERGFKGISAWVPAASTIAKIPFTTNFNTGQGLKLFVDGVLRSERGWSDMNAQDILPTWQFALSENSQLSASYDFDIGYTGGSSLRLEGPLVSNDAVDMLLYKVNLEVDADTKIDVIFKDEGRQLSNFSIVLTFDDEETEDAVLPVEIISGGNWVGISHILDAYAGQLITKIGLRFEALESVDNYNINIGEIKIHKGDIISSTHNLRYAESSIIKILHHQHVHIAEISWSEAVDLSYQVYDLNGHVFSHGVIDKNNHFGFEIPTMGLPSGMYIFSVNDGSTIGTKKLVVAH